MEIGRNDSCPCGSGKKFKKCCIDKPEYQWQPPQGLPSRVLDNRLGRELGRALAVAGTRDEGTSRQSRSSRRSAYKQSATSETPLNNLHWSFGKLQSMNTQAIFEQLQAFGIPLTELEFMERADSTESIEEFLNQLITDDQRLALGRNADFPWLATYTLTERLRPDKPFLDHLTFWLEEGYSLEERSGAKACDTWWPVWTFVIDWARKHGVHCINELDKRLFDHTRQYVSNWLADFDELLHNTGLTQNQYVHRRLELSRAALAQFTQSEGSYLLNWGRAEGESLFRLHDPLAGDAAYAALAQRFPAEAFAYIGWGDEYSPTFAATPAYVDRDKALQIYRMGLEHGTAEDEEIRARIALVNQRSEV